MECRNCKQTALTDENGLCDMCASIEDGARTATPWKVDTLEQEAQRGVFGPDGELVADCFAATADDCGTPENYKANAAFIVLACNNFDALIAAAKGCLGSIGTTWNYRNATDEAGRLTYALAKAVEEAEGRKPHAQVTK